MTASGPSESRDHLFPITPAEYGTEYREHLLKQYKIAVERADAVSDRRATMNEFYLVLTSVILSIVGVGIGGTLAGAPALPGRLVPWVSLVGVVVAMAWLASIYSANQLNRAKFYVINRMEQRLPAKVFTVEWNYRVSGAEVAPKDGDRVYTSSTFIEAIVPSLLFVLFLGSAIYLFANP